MTTPSSLPTIATQLISVIVRLVTLILRILIFPLAKVSAIIFPPHEFDDVRKSGDRAARAFAAEFRKYLNTSRTNDNNDDSDNDVVNPLEITSYSNTVAAARRNNKFLFIYLHSPHHPQAQHFMSHTLADDRVLNFMRNSSQNLMVWASSVHSADGAAVAGSLHVTAYPFVALLSCQRGSGGTVEVLMRMDGMQQRALAQLNRNNGYSRMMSGEIPYNTGEFLAILAAHLLHYQSIIDEAIARRRAREEEAALRAEQDREYEEALEADRRREAERAEAERLEQERIRQEEENIRLEEERRSKELETAKSLVGEEPSPGSGVARLRLFLPSGIKVDRRFEADAKVEVIRAYVKLYFHEKNIDIESFELSMNYPKKVLDDNEETIQDALGGLQAVVMVRDLDA